MSEIKGDWEPVVKPFAFEGCSSCRHYLGSLRCEAYPNEIPIQIASGEVDHYVERPGQVPGILFEPIEELES